MKHTMLYLSILTCCSAFFAFAPTVASCAEVELGVVETTQLCSSDARLQYVVETYPSEITIGDPVYFNVYCENRTDETVPDQVFTFLYDDLYYLKARLFPSDSTSGYLFFPEIVDPRMDVDPDASAFPAYQPHERRLIANGVVELPSLEDFDSDFWREFEQTVPAEGVECRLQFSDLRRNRTQTLETTIRIKPRPESERALLRLWQEQTTEQYRPNKYLDNESGKTIEDFVVVTPDGGREVDLEGYRSTLNRKITGKEIYEYKRPKSFDDAYSWRSVPNGTASDIEVGGASYRPQYFMRMGNRKPSVPNNPTTLAGWRELEEQFSPSALRDELHFVRLQLEYHAASEGAETESAKIALIDWLSDRPAPQRDAFARLLVKRASWYPNGKLSDKQKRLVQALEDRLGKLNAELCVFN